MGIPHILDQLITAIYRLDNKTRKAVKEGSVVLHPSDLTELMDRLDGLQNPVPYEVFEKAGTHEPHVDFTFDGIRWVCWPNFDARRGSPVILLKS